MIARAMPAFGTTIRSPGQTVQEITYPDVLSPDYILGEAW